ncbi:MAG: cytochrome c biogenesis protein CcdA [Endomicrobiaceae bacterium]|nr:cytochrome c biogenesis protein CcdA [Endomicrobiaceae bacterium]
MLTFVSPCVLPLIPAYITFITGFSIDKLNDNKNIYFIFLHSLFFVLGFSFIFVLLGLSATYIGSLFSNNINILRWIGGIVIILFGIHLIGVFKISFLYKQFSSLNSINKKSKNYFSVFVVGCAFAIGWTPCVGPILSSILILASTQGEIVNGAILLTVYSLGLGIPFILTALFINKFLSLFNSIKKYYKYIEITTGVLLIIVGILMITDSFTVITRYIMSSLY